MRILLLGSGGRESALAWKISQSPKVEKLYIAPGNGGTGAYGENIALSPLDFPAIEKTVADLGIDMIVVGNEDPLVAGITDYFEGKDVLVVGPTKAGAELEGSKDVAKAFMTRHEIPTARYRSFTADTLDEGMKFLETLKAPYVLKADGLAAGKGVLIIDSLDKAKEALAEMRRHVWRLIGNSRDRGVSQRHRVLGVRAYRRQWQLPYSSRGKRLQARGRRRYRPQHRRHGRGKSGTFCRRDFHEKSRGTHHPPYYQRAH